MAQTEPKWADALAEAGCHGFLEPDAARAVGAALGSCPEAAALLDNDAREDLRDICRARLATVYERPLIRLAARRVGLVESLSIKSGGEACAKVMRGIAEDVRDEVAADAGASLRGRLPLAAGYERAVAENFSAAISELLDRLLRGRDGVSRELLGGRPIARVTGVSAGSADPHRHGRMVMRVTTDAGEFYYKPHDCGLDALYLELVDAWFSDCARAARLVPGEGYAFVERLVPEGLHGEGELCRYWRNFGCLTALFHSLGSRDMTYENIMCCGVRPAALDLETLLTGRIDFDVSVPAGVATEGIPSDLLKDSVICTSIPPMPMGGRVFSPLVEDNGSGTCLPRVEGEMRTVRGFEQDFCDGFEEGYRRLMQHRAEVLGTLGRHADATCRQIPLNTWAYAQSRGMLFSPGAMSDPGRRDGVLADLNAKYDVFPQELRQAVAEADAAALMEGDIPYYCSRVGSRTLYTGEGRPLGDLLARSALEVATGRLERLSEEELQFELGLIRRCLEAD